MSQNSDNGAPALHFIGMLIIAASVLGAGWMVSAQIRDLDGAPAAPAARAAAPAAAREAPPQPAADPEEPPASIEDWASLVRDYNPVFGPADAPITIVEFSDFECPFCARHHSTTWPELLKRYEGRIRVIFKHFPLPFHSNAKPAAMAAACANREGQFWTLQPKLFQNFRSLNTDMIVRLGRQSGLGDAWENCFRNEETRREVERDMEDGRRAGVRGTPSFLINGVVVPGAVPFEQFETILEDLL